jgi:molecular chaperone GrpE
MDEPNENSPAPADDADPRLATLEAELEAALARAELQRDAQLRLAAELDNLRRRTQREIENERRAALERCVLEFLPVKDGLDFGLAAAGGAADAAKLADGMQATQRLFASALERLGVEELDPSGQPFDPELHEAMMVQPSADHPDGTVLAVVQRGYRVAGRVMRPARVVVSSRPGADHVPVDPPQQGPLFN